MMDLPPPIAPVTEHISTESNVGQSSMPIDIDEIEDLKDQGYSAGLAKSLFKNKDVFPLRIWVIDNSGSMMTCDGHKFVETRTRDDVKTISCTRWNEIQETVEYHAQLAALLRAPTVFRMLNNPGLGAGSQQFSVCERGDEMIAQDIQDVKDIMRRSSPNGTTPLTRHVQEIREIILSLEPSLNSEGKKVAVILATDGLPTDDRGYGGEKEKEEFVEAIKSLEGLPVWIVVRLCTDDDHVVEFYNELDEQLEISIEVLDDFLGEAKEVKKHNAWLNYTLPLHRCREMGFNHRLFDLLDERQLTRGELIDFCQLMLGTLPDGIPHPEADWAGFFKEISSMVENENLQFDPNKNKMGPLIDLYQLNYAYGESSCIIL